MAMRMIFARVVTILLLITLFKTRNEKRWLGWIMPCAQAFSAALQWACTCIHPPRSYFEFIQSRETGLPKHTIPCTAPVNLFIITRNHYLDPARWPRTRQRCCVGTKSASRCHEDHQYTTLLIDCGIQHARCSATYAIATSNIKQLHCIYELAN
jgi:hypothetical protein